MSRMHRNLLAACIVLVFTALAQAQPGFVRGTITSRNQPLRSVWVIISVGGRERGRSLTGDDGKYYIQNLGAGTYDIAVQRGSKLVYKGRVTLPGNRVFDIRI
jgi:hypothetical protein